MRCKHKCANFISQKRIKTNLQNLREKRKALGLKREKLHLKEARIEEKPLPLLLNNFLLLLWGNGGSPSLRENCKLLSLRDPAHCLFPFPPLVNESAVASNFRAPNSISSGKLTLSRPKKGWGGGRDWDDKIRQERRCSLASLPLF